MNVHALVPGDRLLVPKDLVTHCGTYTGNGMVAHNAPDSGPVVVPVEEFSRGRDMRIVGKQVIPTALLEARLEEFCQKNNQYDALANNCEHLCSFLETGERRSPQVVGVVAGGTLGYVLGKGLELESPVATTALVILGGLVGLSMASPGRGDTQPVAL